MKRYYQGCICVGLLLILAATAFGSLFWGAAALEPADVLDALKARIAHTEPGSRNLYNLVIQVRLPRVCLCLLAGAALSVVGILMQTLTGNPLAEPYILGVSSGASAGAAVAIVFRWFAFLPTGRVVFSAFLGSFVAIALVVALQGRSTSPVRLVLTGMGVSAFFQAATTLIIYASNNEAQARSAQYWLTGSFSGSNWADVRSTLAALILLLALCRLLEKKLDLMLLRHLYRQYPANGHIRVDGVPMERISRRQYARRVAVMMQLQSFAESELKVDEVVRTGRYPYKRVILPYDREDEAILEKALRETLILTLHDLNLAARYCDTILLMRSGTILAEGAPSEILTHAWIEKGFGVEVSVIERNEEIYIGV